MLRIAAHRGTRLHAPENSKNAMLGAWVAGANVLEFDLQLTKDNRLVLSHDGNTERLTGQSVRILDVDLKALKELDFSATYCPPNTPAYQYYPPKIVEGTNEPEARKLSILTIEEALVFLPEEAELLIELKHDSCHTEAQRKTFAKLVAESAKSANLVPRSVFYSKNAEVLALLKGHLPNARIAAFDFELSTAAQLDLLKSTGADGLVTALDDVLKDGQLTDFGRALQQTTHDGNLAVGAVLYPFRTPGVFTAEEYEALSKLSFVWSVSTDSMLELTPVLRQPLVMVDESFAGTQLKRSKFALGYAKANRYAEVKQDEGIHLTIDEFPAELLPGPPADDLDRRLKLMEIKAHFTAMDWPYYSGGGLGVLHGIQGDFSAEVDYTVEKVGQATTLEMAVVNVDPGAHVEGRPKSFRDKDSFYDPHGAPPFVGVEHDENDGFRINCNLGSDYDNNQYGRPAGDGTKALGARLRLDRRGPHFAVYYRHAVDAQGTNLGPNDWVCVGTTRNDSLNRVVYLRCVAKRWRQERVSKPDPLNPSDFHPILANHYTFKNLTITRYLRS